jgi:hypothetical protein
MITAFEAACGAGKNDFRHFDPLIDRSAKSTAFVRASPGYSPKKPCGDKGGGSGVVGLKRTALGELEAAF